MTHPQVWLVTGVSTGLGKQFANCIYQAGHIVLGTVRTESDRQAFEATYSGRGWAFVIDLSYTNQINPLIDEIRRQFGRIDVLINNAGYGLMGLLEEVSEAEVRHQLEVNVVAVWKLTQAVLPLMRKQRSGRIIQLSSRVGLAASAGGGLYAASKFALEGLSEALRQEAAPFGIQVMLVEPGPLRTEFFGRSVVYAQQRIDAYYSVLTDFRQTSKQLNGRQPGDPAKVAQAIVEAAERPELPFRLPFTQATIDTLLEKIRAYQQTVADWGHQATRVSIGAED